MVVAKVKKNLGGLLPLPVPAPLFHEAPNDINNDDEQLSPDGPSNGDCSSQPPAPPALVVVQIDLPPLPPELQKYSTRMCLLSNVNKEATREDILELFREYGPIDETLKIRHDDLGQPTGDAIVACVTQASSRAAVRALNGHRFMGQHIKALLVAPSTQ